MTAKINNRSYLQLSGDEQEKGEIKLRGRRQVGSNISGNKTEQDLDSLSLSRLQCMR